MLLLFHRTPMRQSPPPSLLPQTGPVVRRTKRYIRFPNMVFPFIHRSSEMWNFPRGGRPDRCPSEMKGEPMKKTLMALAAVAAVAVSAVAAPQTAEARNGRIAAGVAAGLIGGAIVGGA